ncbi:holocytochrome-c1 synthase [[Candida] jaroonii]|uniref:Holocytochrome-c1 synthase n=1 Tax=[Candida] jaroonii TaxID=467808 RepID=A0ACA9YBW4_9ASCO|nr:holocytochrome-c1 synthase [[Candida] jaroonii]
MGWTSWFWASPESSTNNISCPVPHQGSSCPVDHNSIPKKIPDQEQPVCPVDHETRENWVKNIKVTATVPEAIEVDKLESCTSDKETSIAGSTTNLPSDREISSIPRTSTESNWIYPSEKQFFEAMKRKNWSPEASDMKTVVPIHNNVNERTWAHILNWERSFDTSSCGGLKLTSFKGNPKKLTPRAWVKSVIGAEKPFDRHDWLVDRCGTEIEYVIDYYAIENGVFIDARPKLNSWEGVKLRLGRGLGFY